jgi:hypothetical protein
MNDAVVSIHLTVSSPGGYLLEITEMCERIKRQEGQLLEDLERRFNLINTAQLALQKWDISDKERTIAAAEYGIQGLEERERRAALDLCIRGTSVGSVLS